MTGGPNRSLEELLSDRLREVDAVEPPSRDFEFRALRAGRERMKRRQAWTRGLIGAAAAVVIGAVAIPSLGRLDTSGGGSATSAGSAAGSAASAPEAATGGAPKDLSAPGNQPDGVAPSPAPAPGGDATLTLPIGQVPFDWRSADGAARLSRLREALAGPQYAGDGVTLTVDESVSPPRLTVRLVRYAPEVVSLVTSAFPPGAPIVFIVGAGGGPT
jgi:hypothetical protein